MTVHEFNLKTLMEHLDGGRIAEAFAAEVKRVAMDCDSRPADPKPRKVKLEAELIPVCIDGHLDEIRVKFHATSTVPARRSKVYSFGYRRNGVLVFNDLADDNINQATFDQFDSEED